MGDIGTIEVLLQNRANPNILDKDGVSILDLAIKSGKKASCLKKNCNKISKISSIIEYFRSRERCRFTYSIWCRRQPS